MENQFFSGLAHLGIFTDDYEQTMHFYTQQLPFSVVYTTTIEKPDDASGAFPMKFAMIRLNEMYIEIMECANHWGTNNGVNGVVNHVGIRVTNLEKAIAELKAKGVPDERFGQINIELDQIPGRSFRQCRVKGWNGEMIGLYEVDNDAYYGNLYV